MIDLHMHSHCSDGEMTPEELVQWGMNIGLTAMAITDHDTTVGSLRAIDQGKKIGQKVLSAVEITTSYKGNILHLLAYDFPYYHQELSRRLSEIQAQRILRTETIITLLNDDLNNEGLEIIESSEILKMGQEKPISPSDIALYLLKNRYINSLQEAFDRWLGRYNIPNDNFSISEAIDLVRSTGGVAVLAHPFAQDISLKAIGFDLKSQVEMLKELRTLGLDGFEVYHFRRTNRKGYIRLSIYHKMRKRQYGNRWMTQFVPLCREEVRRLEERKQIEQNETIGNTMQDYITDIENGSQYTNNMHEVTF